MPKYTVNNHSVLNVNNDEAKQGASWHDIARGRAHKQHGDVDGKDLPEEDIHAVKRHEDHHLPQTDPHEMNQELDSLESQIKMLQQTEAEKANARQLAQEQHEKQTQKDTFGDNPYDDWFKD